MLRDWTGARVARGRAQGNIDSVTTDSRQVPVHSIFIALRGERFDGNEYCLEALVKGATAAIVEPGRAPGPEEIEGLRLDGRCVLEHPNPGAALLEIARRYRESFAIPVVAVGGAAGKTTTKDIAAHVFQRFGPTVASEKSFNNAIGVPLTLLRLDKETRYAIVEVGTNAPGEVAALAAIVKPTIGLVTVIAEEHLEGLGTLEGVAAEEGDLLPALPKDGTAILNADDRFFETLARRAPCQVLTFGLENPADYRAEGIVFHAAGVSFTVKGRSVTVPLLGTHSVYNCLAALAAAGAAGIGLDDALATLSDLRTPHRRLERKRFGEVEVIDDCYNANPGSVRAAIRALDGLRNGRRRIFVLGKMHELGAASAALHRETGFAVGQAQFDLFVVVGGEGAALAAGAVEAGFPASRILRFPTTDDAAYHAGDFLHSGDLVLVKGSRAEGLERVVDAIRTRFEGMQQKTGGAP
jgi:UDP-N-acetylmuramoyl-tripeptide--D-alanyl-D-alanine ligase